MNLCFYPTIMGDLISDCSLLLGSLVATGVVISFVCRTDVMKFITSVRSSSDGWMT
jgi:hypothetical protein